MRTNRQESDIQVNEGSISTRTDTEAASRARGDVSRLAVANAPVSYGAFEITVGVDPAVPEPLTLLDWVQEACYEGVDLGPVGYLGDTETLAARLGDHELGLAGGYLELPFSEPEKLGRAMAELEALLDVFDTVGGDALRPKPTLADAGSPTRSRYPGRAALDASVGLDDAAWKRFADGLARAADRCRERGYDPTFHHHTATYIEAQWEIERLLEISDVGLCLDTGHLLLGRGEPITAIRDWADRINQVHLKDARMDRLEEIVSEAAPVEEIWRRQAFCALGDGDIDIEQVLAALSDINYLGWLVVEQDVLPDPANPGQPALDQRRNRDYLRAHGL
ncbi:MAG TPA: TIM barrel protein [Solirubrobacteraceae bacterium]|jgi:inosose dehydratase|nr:TIM barrel protein [Solirubrobacteraceae bacterium]